MRANVMGLERRWHFSWSLLPLLAACVGDNPAPPLTDASVDVSQPIDGAIPVDAGPDIATDTGDAAVTTYNDITNAAFWETYDLTANIDPNAKGFDGAVFDGRYIYLVPGGYPNPSGLMLRYDSKAAFTSSSGWSQFDLATQVSPTLRGFAGGLFDGRYLYLVPYSNTPNVYTGVSARYDTQAGFASATSWSSFDVKSVNPNAVGFTGGAFDGQYTYFVPTGSTVVARYDSKATFTQGAAWSTFDLTTVDANASGYLCAAFDGRYLYFSPYGSSTSSGLVLRHDTQQAFSAGWTKFDAKSVNANASGYAGVVFDGRYVYFVPYKTANGPGSLVLRNDTQAPFTQASSWATFDIASKNAVAKGFNGGTFDGRYVYFSPDPPGGSSASGVVARLDVTGSFGSPNAWETFDVASVNGQAKGFAGVAFDGAYVYFAPYSSGTGGTIARFHAKSPSSLPPKPQGSFF